MALTVRLDPATERAMNAVARRKRLTRSQVVREALAQYAAREEGPDGGRPYDAWIDVLGVVSLGVRDPARTSGEQFAASLRARSRARRPR